MIKFAAFTAAAALALLAAAPAGAQPAGQTVRISVAGKTVAQVNAEIGAAARAVCGAADQACVEDAIHSARRQLAALTHRAERPDEMRVAMLEGGVYAVRVSLVGKSAEQVDKALDEAAVAVCRPATVGGSEYRACVNTALDSAHAQLHGVQRLASAK